MRIHGDWVVCTLHHETYLLADERNAIDLALELVKGWRSQAQHHDLDAMQLYFDRATDDLVERRELIKDRREALDRIERESAPNDSMRVEMGERTKRNAIEYPTAFARVLSEVAHYLGEDWRQFADDMVETAGHGDAAREWLHAELLDTSGKVQPGGFMADLAAGLGLDHRQRDRLAMAYTYGK